VYAIGAIRVKKFGGVSAPAVYFSSTASQKLFSNLSPSIKNVLTGSQVKLKNKKKIIIFSVVIKYFFFFFCFIYQYNNIKFCVVVERALNVFDGA
jgi:hypothetical protein